MPNSSFRLSFYGATGTVTGSKYLLETPRHRILIDCGLFQGLKELRLRNWASLPFDPRRLDAVILTHAHIDHSGYLPLLVKQGYRGPIYCTQGTYDLCRILLPDSARIQEEDAERANRYHYSKHHLALPLYTEKDAKRALRQFKPVDFESSLTYDQELSFQFYRAGHILGAAFVQFQLANTSLVFSGDLGRPHDPIMKPPHPLPPTDYLILESTYGLHLHGQTNPLDQLAQVIRRTAQHGGSILIPTFAVGRAQSLLYYLYQLKTQHRIPNLPVFLDSPMSIDATELLMKHVHELSLDPSLVQKICSVATYIHTPEESKALDHNPMPKIILSASGMMTGGRILHHLKRYAPFPEHTLLFTGYQAAGTRGARLLAGENVLKIHGQMVPVQAHIEVLENTSAHADYAETLQWLRSLKQEPKKILLTHGEPTSLQALQQHIQDQFGWKAYIPEYLETIELSNRL